MFLYEKQKGRIKISNLYPNMEEIKKLKEYEMYGRLNYLTMLRAECQNQNTVLLFKAAPHKMGLQLNAEAPIYWPGYHKLENDFYLPESEAFANLEKVINEPELNIVEYLDNYKRKMCYLALTDPEYRICAIRNNKEIKEMTGIVPVSERIYNANKLVTLINAGDLENLNSNMPEGYFAENPELLDIKESRTPYMWITSVEDLYKYGVINGSMEDFERKLEISNDIMGRVRKK